MIDASRLQQALARCRLGQERAEVLLAAVLALEHRALTLDQLRLVGAVVVQVCLGVANGEEGWSVIEAWTRRLPSLLLPPPHPHILAIPAGVPLTAECAKKRSPLCAPMERAADTPLAMAFGWLRLKPVVYAPAQNSRAFGALWSARWP